MIQNHRSFLSEIGDPLQGWALFALETDAAKSFRREILPAAG
jgi:hypothetical protein